MRGVESLLIERAEVRVQHARDFGLADQLRQSVVVHVGPREEIYISGATTSVPAAPEDPLDSLGGPAIPPRYYPPRLIGLSKHRVDRVHDSVDVLSDQRARAVRDRDRPLGA